MVQMDILHSEEQAIMADNRKFERHKIHVPVNIMLLSQEEKGVFSVHTDNLSAEGAFLPLEDPPSPGSPVALEIFLQFDELISVSDPAGILAISASGHVLRSGPEGTAIRFNQEEYKFRIGDS
jgi:hypothetical protein